MVESVLLEHIAHLKELAAYLNHLGGSRPEFDESTLTHLAGDVMNLEDELKGLLNDYDDAQPIPLGEPVKE